MRAGSAKLLLSAIVLSVAGISGPNPAAAADLALVSSGRGGCSEFIFACENGHSYPLCPIALSVVGEVVTASLYTSPGRATHVRLIPMGVGYRYAGRGVWLDGVGENALLNFGKHSQIACSIQPSS